MYVVMPAIASLNLSIVSCANVPLPVAYFPHQPAHLLHLLGVLVCLQRNARCHDASQVIADLGKVVFLPIQTPLAGAICVNTVYAHK